MGVDYSGNYGIGVKLVNIDFDNDDEFEYMGDYVDDLPKSEHFNLEYFEVGAGSYTGEENDFFLCVENPFEKGIEGFIRKINEFKKYLKENNIEYVGDIDCVGGLEVY